MNNPEMNELRKKLNTQTLEVTFRKVNGDIRVMTCTTNLDAVPPSMWPSKKIDESAEPKYGTQLRVFDINAQGWRSFKFENVISYHIKETI